MNQPIILVADDEQIQREMLTGSLQQKGYELLQTGSGKDAIDIIRKHNIDLLLTDLRMPGMDGIELLQEVRQINPLIQVIVMTAYGSVERAVEAMQLGAFTFLTKPIDLGSLTAQIERALEWKLLQAENRELKVRLGEIGQEGLVARSPEMQEVLSIVARVASSRASVLILGESGTGKEVLARTLHAASERSDKPFVPVNIAAIPENLLESELFGYERGAFTGASGRHTGRFERASGGTLFIDEIGDMPLAAQVKLLRVLQEQTIERVGGEMAVPIDVRVVAATHRDLEAEIRNGRFREDLFYRLNVVRLIIPALRKRKDDIRPLIEHFVRHYSQINDKPVTGVESEALDQLLKYHWPGNVRELENAIESALVLSRGSLITLRDLPQSVRDEKSFQSHESASGHPEFINDPDLPLPERLDQIEKQEVLRALEEADGNKTEAARRLGMSDKNIRDRLKRWGI